MKRKTLLLAAIAALSLLAQSSGILHPEMAVQTGSYDKPAATIGVKGSEPWTSTTIEAAVAKKANPGKTGQCSGRNRRLFLLFAAR